MARISYFNTSLRSAEEVQSSGLFLKFLFKFSQQNSSKKRIELMPIKNSRYSLNLEQIFRFRFPSSSFRPRLRGAKTRLLDFSDRKNQGALLCSRISFQEIRYIFPANTSLKYHLIKFQLLLRGSRIYEWVNLLQTSLSASDTLALTHFTFSSSVAPSGTW